MSFQLGTEGVLRGGVESAKLVPFNHVAKWQRPHTQEDVGTEDEAALNVATGNLLFLTKWVLLTDLNRCRLITVVHIQLGKLQTLLPTSKP